MTFKCFSHNGMIKPIEEAVVPLSSIEYSYGFGVYETVRVNASTLYFLDDHIGRLIESARIIGLEHSNSADMIARSARNLIASTDARAFNLKILLVGGKLAADANLYVMCLNPLFPDKHMYRDGVKTITVQHERSFPHAKTLSMLGSYLAYQKARSADAYDALLVDQAGNIIEGTRTNFFCIKDKTLFSPPEEKILLGVTRKAVLAVAGKKGFKLWEGDISLAHLADYDGTFLTSTSSNIMPIRSIDDHTFGDAPPPLRALMVVFDRFLDASKGEM